MKLASINVKDTFQKNGGTKKIFINIDDITAIEHGKYGYRIVLKTTGSIAPPKAGDAYPKSFFELFSYQVSEAQAQTLLAHINTIVAITDLCVDDAGGASIPAPSPAQVITTAGF